MSSCTNLGDASFIAARGENQVSRLVRRSVIAWSSANLGTSVHDILGRVLPVHTLTAQGAFTPGPFCSENGRFIAQKTVIHSESICIFPLFCAGCRSAHSHDAFRAKHLRHRLMCADPIALLCVAGRRHHINMTAS